MLNVSDRMVLVLNLFTMAALAGASFLLSEGRPVLVLVCIIGFIRAAFLVWGLYRLSKRRADRAQAEALRHSDY